LALNLNFKINAKGQFSKLLEIVENYKKVLGIENGIFIKSKAN